MKAIQIKSYGGSEVVEVVTNADVPHIIEGHVLVKVKKASINPIDYLIRNGYLQHAFQLQFPATLGTGFSGTIEKIGMGVEGFNIGDKVFGSGTQYVGGTGSFAEFVLVPSENFVHQPNNMSDEQAAVIPSSSLTAYIALYEYAQIKSGDKILIHGGGGGVGSVAIQLAKFAGAHVATTVKGIDFPFVKDLGADEVIDYKESNFEDRKQHYDLVLDNVGGETYRKSFQVLKKGGTILSLVEQPDSELMKIYNVNALNVAGMITPKRLQSFCKIFNSTNLQIKIGKTFSIDQGKEAFKFDEHGHTNGKTIIEIS